MISLEKNESEIGLGCNTRDKVTKAPGDGLYLTAAQTPYFSSYGTVPKVFAHGPCGPTVSNQPQFTLRFLREVIG